MRRVVKWLLRGLAVAAVLLCAALLVQIFMLPGLVQRQVVRQLRAVGLSSAAVQVRRVDWGGAELHGFRLSDEPFLSIDEAHVRYTPAGLLSGRVRTLSLTGLRLQLTYRQGRLDLGPLKDLVVPRDTTAEDLPFDRLELRSSLLAVALEDGVLHIPVEGVAARGQGAMWALDLQAAVRDQMLRMTLEASRADRRIELTGIHIVAQPRGFSAAAVGVAPLPGARVQLRAAADGRPLSIEWSEDGWRVDTQGLGLSIGGADVWAGGRRWRIAPTQWSIEPLDAAFLVQSAGGPPRLSARIAAPAGLLVESESLSLGAGGLEIRARQVPLGDLPAGLDAVIEFSQAFARDEALGLSLSAADGRLPIRIDTAGDAEPGTFSVKEIRLGDRTLPAMTGTLAMDREGLAATARWPVSEAAVVTGAARLGTDGLRIAARLPMTEVQELRPLLEGLVDLRGAEISGRVAGTLDLNTSGEHRVAGAQIQLDGAGYRHADRQTQVDGMSGTVTLQRLAPLASPGGQRLRVERFQQGRITLTDGLIMFRIEAPDRLFIERTQWTVGDGGRVAAHAIRYDRDRPLVETELFIDDLNLEDWLSVLTQEQVSATGRLYGRVPLRVGVRESRYQVAFGEGFLYSTAPSGTLRIPAAAGVSQMLAQADPRFATDSELVAVRQRLAAALTDFEYSIFRFDLIPQEDRTVTLRVRTSGKGRGPQGQEIGSLTVNVNNFGQAANIALFGQWLLGEGLEQRLEEFFRPAEPARRREVQP